MSREIQRRIEKLATLATTLTTRQVVAVVLELPDCPPWAEPLDEGRCVLLGLGTPADRETVLEALRAGDETLPETVLHLEYRRVASEFIADAVDGRDASELLATSPRGEGKSQAALGAMLCHALVHGARGFGWPVRWLVVGPTLLYLSGTVGRSMTADFWRGAWTLTDEDRTARLTVDGTVLVAADLQGVETEADADKLRREVHAAWADEPAAALIESAAGITRKAWGIAFSSCRLPTHRRVGLLTSNAPSPRSWVWKRFVLSPEPGCRAYRIPKGERTTAEYRADLARQFADAPDLLARLAEGEAALPIHGLPVAKGYSDRLCVAPRRLELQPHRTVYLGHDAGLTPACTIVQPVNGQAWVFASFCIERGGTAELVDQLIRPWLVERCPWVFRERHTLIHCCDPNMATPSQHTLADSPERTLAQLLPGAVRFAPVKWAPRRDALLACFTPGRSRLWVSPGEETEELRVALGGGFHYRTTTGGDVRGQEPDKSHPHSDLVDSLIHILCELWPATDREARSRDTRPRAKSKMDFNVFATGLSRRW